MANDETAAARENNPECPECGAHLSGDELQALKCSGCGAELPPRIGI
jgi:tRNA(Ile2) C34 agmatinyltransferase TiaS